MFLINILFWNNFKFIEKLEKLYTTLQLLQMSLVHLTFDTEDYSMFVKTKKLTLA